MGSVIEDKPPISLKAVYNLILIKAAVWSFCDVTKSGLCTQRLGGSWGGEEEVGIREMGSKSNYAKQLIEWRHFSLRRYINYRWMKNDDVFLASSHVFIAVRIRGWFLVMFWIAGLGEGGYLRFRAFEGLGEGRKEIILLPDGWRIFGKDFTQTFNYRFSFFEMQ